MTSTKPDTPTNPQAISKWSWTRWADKLHRWFMGKMDIVGDPELGLCAIDAQLLELIFLGLALPGEVGEMCNDIKKMWRDGRTPELEAKLRKEVSDVKIYLYHIEQWLGGDADQDCADKLAELMVRWPHIAKAIGYE